MVATRIAGALAGGWFPEAWEIPVAIGLGVVATGYLGDTVAGFISQWVPAAWLNPVSELVIGVLLFMLGGWVGGDISMWLRLLSFGAFAVGIADVITMVLGMAPGAPTPTVRVVSPTGVRTVAARTTGKVGKY